MAHTRRQGWAGRLVGVAVLLVSVWTNDRSGHAAGADPDTSAIPRIEEGSCPSSIPASDRVRCLTLVVPETRQGSGAERLVRLPVVVIAATDSEHRLPDPVLWIDYSAGDGAVGIRVRNFTEESLALNERRDVITLDLRGTGLAEPALTCPEVTELNRGPFAEDVDETTPEGRSMRLDAIGRCRDRLVADGVDLSAYAADDAAEDLEDLRVALGVEQWNIVAGEYGSKLAQLLARDHPEGVRTVVVNSTPIPLQADWFSDLAANAAGGWAAVVAACTSDSGCAEAFPDITERLDTLVTDLDANPRHHDEVVDVTDGREPLLVTASRMLSYVRFYTRDSNFHGAMPMHLAGPLGGQADLWPVLDPDDPATLIYVASDVRIQPAWGIWELIPQNSTSDLTSYAFGAHLSAVCRDEAPFADPADLAEAATVPLFGPFLGRHADLEACDVWDVEPAPPAADEPVASDVPFLVLAGDFDTVSSPAWADAFADGLRAAQIVHFAGTGTQPTGGPQTTAQICARQIRDQFLAQPDEPIDRACVATSHGPPFLLP
jgi:pimeloyl-ACP methyl ester carboxylesterase